MPCCTRIFPNTSSRFFMAAPSKHGGPSCLISSGMTCGLRADVAALILAMQASDDCDSSDGVPPSTLSDCLVAEGGVCLEGDPLVSALRFVGVRTTSLEEPSTRRFPPVVCQKEHAQFLRTKVNKVRAIEPRQLMLHPAASTWLVRSRLHHPRVGGWTSMHHHPRLPPRSARLLLRSRLTRS